MPVVTTPNGSAGMMANESDSDGSDDSSLLFGGRVASTLKDFCTHAVELAVNKTAYQNAQEAGHRLLGQLYHGQRNWEQVHERLMETKRHLTERRGLDYTRAMLWHRSNRSTEYFSRWIELKEQQTQNHSTRGSRQEQQVSHQPPSPQESMIPISYDKKSRARASEWWRSLGSSSSVSLHRCSQYYRTRTEPHD
jgi:hypothetical protein